MHVERETLCDVSSIFDCALDVVHVTLTISLVRYDERAVNCSRELFNALPLAHVVQEKVRRVVFVRDSV
jgi:hypothetical protein